MTKMRDRSEAIARGDAPPPPIAQLIGFDLISVKPGEAVIRLIQDAESKSVQNAR